jgi:thiol peroxidase
MEERKGMATFQGNPLTLLGPELKVGDKAPDFLVIDNGLTPVKLADFKGKIKLLCTVPTLDASVCDIQTRRLNEEAAAFPDKVVVLTVSMDLPFAQGRWCGAAGVDRVKTLSDYQERSMAADYGVLISELKLMARAIFLVDETDTIRYIERVKELSDHIDYDATLGAVKALL